MKRVDKEQSILITGGAGFIGSNLARRLLSMGYKVVVFDNLQTGNLENIKSCLHHDNFTFLKGDVNNLREISYAFRNKFDYIYHYAACVGVERTLKNPLEVLADIDGFKNILSLAIASRVKRFFYSSSSEVYGEPVSFPQNEEVTPLNSRLPYAVIKNLGEVFLKTYQKEYGLDYTVFRFFNTYGPGQSANFVVTKFINQALKGEDITVYGDGQQTRSFIYVEDNINATTAAITRQGAMNQVINIGNDHEITVKDLASKIITLCGSKSKIVHLPPLKEGDMKRRLPDVTMMKQILGVAPTSALDKGLKTTIEYFREGLYNNGHAEGLHSYSSL